MGKESIAVSAYRKKQVAVLDVGSSKITAVVGERGVNKTFVIKAKKDFLYDGYSDGEFFDAEGLKAVLHECGDFITNSSAEEPALYVGVPGEFTSVTVKDSQISFPKKKRIDDKDIDSLFDAAFVLSSAKSVLINRSAVIFELDDYRRLNNPVGEYSEILKGRLSFITCSKYFIESVKPALRAVGIENIEFVSASLAEAMYLLEPETRDRIAVILDIGHISSTFSLIQGDGILYQNSFGYGGGYITALLIKNLGVSYEIAETLKRKVNLSRVVAEGNADLVNVDSGEYFNAETVRETIKASLDDLCEMVADAVDNSGYVIPEYVTLSLTGGGITHIRGAKEFVSGRLGCVTETLTPKPPVFGKPEEASLYSLLDLTLG